MVQWTMGVSLLEHDNKRRQRTSITDMMMVQWTMGVSLLEHGENEKILEEAKVERIPKVMRRVEWLGHIEGT